MGSKSKSRSISVSSKTPIRAIWHRGLAVISVVVRSSVFERSGLQYLSLVPIGSWQSQLSGHCEDGRASCSTQGQSAGKRKIYSCSRFSVMFLKRCWLVDRLVTRPLLTTLDGSTSTRPYMHPILYVPRVWAIIGPWILYDNRFSPSVQLCTGFSLVLSHRLYIHHTSFFRCSPRGFSATCLQQMQGSVVEGLSQTATSSSQCFLSETLSCALS